MASFINANNINGAYPVAGQDNDSQGFRDNFTNTRTNFQFASEEITDLQEKVILRSPLGDGAAPANFNNMGGSPLIAFEARDVSYTFENLGSVSGSPITIDYTLAPFQQLTTSGSVEIAFTNFPATGIAGVVTVAFVITDTAHIITFPASVGAGNSLKSAENIVGFNLATGTLTFGTTGTYVFEFRTNDGGSSIYIEDLVRSAGATALEQLNDVDITGVADNNLLAYNSANNAWENVSLTDLDLLTDVDVTSPADNDVLIYNGDTSAWENVSDPVFLPVTDIVVTVADNGSGTQDVFYFDGTALKTDAGVTIDFQFQVNNRYRFDVSDPSNGEFKFSTTPDTIVPDTITDFTTGVTTVGSPGTAGAYVEIVITEETPSPLYFWTPDLTEPSRDGSLIGAALPISVGQINYFFGEDTFAANGNISLQTTTTVITSSGDLEGTLAAGESGQVKILAYGNTSAGNTLVTVANAAWGGSNIANLSATGSAATFQYVGNKWFCTGNNGVTFS
jgi:hypothetical protein